MCVCPQRRSGLSCCKRQNNYILIKTDLVVKCKPVKGWTKSFFMLNLKKYKTFKNKRMKS